MDRFTAVRKWLDEHVTVIESVSTLEIKNITFQIDKYGGEFDAVINGTSFPFSFTGDNPNGRITVSPPFVHSPLGVPFTYSLLEMPESVYSEIQEMLDEYIPPLRPFGLDKKTGQIITVQYSLSDRIKNKKTVLKSIKVLQKTRFKIQIK